MKKSISTLMFLVAFHGLLYSQPVKIKYGKVSMEELTMEKYDKDPSAEAVVLYDQGSSVVSYQPSVGWKLDFRRTCRIKIFNSNGFEWATEKILVYDYAGNKESVGILKGVTYNLVNGKIEEQKLSKENIFREDLDKYRDVVKFTMPNVKEGSVIEFTYTISTDRYATLRDWQFQKPIPVAWSEYTVRTPEYFNYLHLSQGFEAFKTYETRSEAGTLSLGTDGNINYRTDVYYWVAEDMPALKDEDFISDASNFYQKVEFQLATYKEPYGMITPVLGTWEKITSELMLLSEFGSQMKPKGFYKDVLASLTADADQPAEKAMRIYDYISKNIKWNGNNNFITSGPIKKTFDDKVGQSADINMLLISMLNAADIKAYPVITSTRNHGVVNPIHPIIDKYNYLIAEVVIDGQSVLMDATAPNLLPGMLPTRALNQLGRRISEENPGWVNIDAHYPAGELKFCTMRLEEDGTLSGNIQQKKSGYEAVHTRNIVSIDGSQKYLSDMKEKLPGWEIENHVFENLENSYSDIVEKFDVTISNGAMSAGNMIYLKPIFDKGGDKNPFQQEIRKLPIDFTYPIFEKHIVTFALPEGYKVEEMPQAVSMSTPDNACRYLFNVKQLGSQIQVTSDLSINKSFFSPEEYQQLREFFNVLNSKINEQIVLKKI